MEPNSTAYQKTIAICLIILTTIAVTVALKSLQVIMVPFTLSLFLYFMTSPFVSFFENYLKLSKKLAVILTLVLALFLVILLGFIATVSISNFLKSAELYNERLLEIIKQINDWLSSWNIQQFSNDVEGFLSSGEAFLFAKNLTGHFINLVGNFFLILVFLIFLLLGESSIKTSQLYRQIQNKVSKYTWTKSLTSLATGLLVGFSLYIIGLDLAFMFGLLAFLLNFIPNIGSMIAILLPLPIALLQFGISWQLIYVLLIPSAIQMTIGNFIEPKLMGDQLGLRPTSILFFLLFWGIVWGIPGMFLAVPITAILKYILSQFSITQTWAKIL
ncbi:MAG: AI-2E family transporter [Bdellovibrio sp.]|nr:MAG: AI-2E family transporter [Bdellovibrio sp.]